MEDDTVSFVVGQDLVARLDLAGQQSIGQALGMDPGLPSFFYAIAVEITCALNDQGVPLPDVAAILGHSSVATTANIYMRPSEADLRKHLDRAIGEEGDE